MNTLVKKRKRTLSLNKGRPRHERVSTEPETTAYAENLGIGVPCVCYLTD